MKFSHLYFLLALFLTVICCGASPDHRPPFNKEGYRGTLWTQVNPWWPPNKPRSSVAQGGANFARKIYSDEPEEYWLEAIRECQEHGMTGWQFELVVPTPGWADVLKQVIRAAEKSDGFKMALMLDLFKPEGGVEEGWAQLQGQMDCLKEEWENSQVLFRLDGRPVIMLYMAFSFTPEECGELINRFEAKYGPAIWLANIWWGTYDVASKPEQLRAYLPYLDGISAYANWGSNRELYQVVGEIMHNEFPEKIFEASVLNSHSVHYTHAGVFPETSRTYLDSWETMHEAHPDAVVMTNLFDHWENSLILPCYERENFVLRYAEYQMKELYENRTFKASTSPEIVVTNYIDLMPSWRPLGFEVIAFPLDGNDKNISFSLEICNAVGEVLHRFPEEQIVLDKLHVFTYELPTENFAQERAVIPRITATYAGQPWHSAFNPPTIIDPSLRGSLMYWARSTRNALRTVNDVTTWSINGEGPGGTVDWNVSHGSAFFAAQIKPEGQNVTRVRILRNGNEFQSWKQNALELGRIFPLPYPGDNQDYYWLEMETADGNRFQTLPIWVTADPFPRIVQLHYFSADKKEVVCDIEASRVPVFNYPCDIDTGMILMDIGGRQHHGRLNQHVAAYGFGSLGHTGYGHQVDGYVPEEVTCPLFKRDSDGTGFLHFQPSDEYFYLLTGGTAFPFESTYEIEIRPGEPNGTKRGIIGTVNGHIQLWLDEQGYLKAMRGGAAEGVAGAKANQTIYVELTSRQPVTAGQWHRIAVVYDMHEFKLYLDGELQEAGALGPNPDHVTLNYVTVGSLMGFLQNPSVYYEGDIRRVRLTGRALTPEELAKGNY